MSKISKKTSSALTTNIIIFLIFIGIAFFWVYPNFLKTEAKKQDLAKLVNTYNKIKNSGIDFGDFQKQIEEEIQKIGNNKKLSYKKEKLEKLMFLKKYLELLKTQNKTNKNFLEFINQKTLEIEKIENSTNIVSLEKNIENILPSYVENDETISTLTDLNFVNYLEKLFLAFNIKNDSEIGIGNIIAVDDNKKVNKTNLKEDQIFYIPIKLKLSGKKANILKFLYFIENVGRIQISKIKDDNKKETIKIKILDDETNFLQKQKEILGDKNIYANILSTISEIKFNEYPDSQLAKEKNISGEKDFIKYIEENQYEDDYKISLELDFYIKGLAKYKLKEYIINIINDYNKTLINLNKFSKISQKELFKGKNPLLISKLEKLKLFLEKKQKEILNTKKTLNKQKNLIPIYNKMKEMELKLNQAKEILEKLNNKNSSNKIKNK